MKSFYATFILIVLLSIGNSLSQSGNSESGANPKIQITELGFTKIVELPFDDALKKVKSELKKEGFGILTEVDVKATLKKKLDVEFKPYQILGACNPPLAHQALQAEMQIGLMLPCKIIVYVNDDDKTVISAVDPVRMMQGVENEELSKVAKSVQEKFKKVLLSI